MKYYKAFAPRSFSVGIVDVYHNFINTIFRCHHELEFLDRLPDGCDLTDQDDYGSYEWIGVKNDCNTIQFLQSGDTYHTPDLCCIISGYRLGYVKKAQLDYWKQEVSVTFSSGETVVSPLCYKLVKLA